MSLPSPEFTWFILGIIFLALELILPGFVIFFFGVGAWVTAIAVFAFSFSLNGQLVIFLISSLVCLFSLRKYIQRTFLGEKHGVNEVDEALASGGESAVVIEDIIPPSEGKVRYSGTSWRALSDETFEKDEVVTIVSQDGLIMKVAKKI